MISTKTAFNFTLKAIWIIFSAALIFFSSVDIGITSDTVDVAVSILPQKYFVEKIAGDHVNVLVMVPPGGNPATYEPKPRQMARLLQCKIYFSIGVPFENSWLPRFSSTSRDILIISTERGIEKRHMTPAPHILRVKGQHHGTKDPHVWLSPPLVMLQVRNILEGLIRAYPEKEKTFEANYRIFIKEVVDLDLMIRSVFSGVGEHNRFLVFHPAWGYFAETYGLKQIALEAEGKKPLARQMGEFKNLAKKLQFDTLFVQPQFPSRIPHAIANSIGAKLEQIDPLAYPWKENLMEVAKKIRPALR